MNNFHLFLYSSFAKDYIEMVNELYTVDENTFFIMSGYSGYPDEIIKKASNVVFGSEFNVSIKKICYIFFQMVRSKKIIIHSLFVSKSIMGILLLLQPFLGYKYYWYIWGGDLYGDEEKKSIERLTKPRRIFIKNITHIISSCIEDYKYARKYCHTKAIYFNASYAGNFSELPAKTISDTTTILLGNSNTKSNMHLAALKRLRFIADKDIKIICPLSYGGSEKDYVLHVIDMAKTIYGNKFVPVLKKMRKEKYLELLNSIDIAIFANARQQGGANILHSIEYGKKVYISSKNPFYNQCKNRGYKIFRFEDINENDFFELLNEEAISENKRIIKENHSKYAFQKEWEKILE